MHARALGVRDVMKLMGVINFCKRPWMWSAQLAALFPISILCSWQPGSTVTHLHSTDSVDCRHKYLVLSPVAIVISYWYTPSDKGFGIRGSIKGDNWIDNWRGKIRGWVQLVSRARSSPEGKCLESCAPIRKFNFVTWLENVINTVLTNTTVCLYCCLGFCSTCSNKYMKYKVLWKLWPS